MRRLADEFVHGAALVSPRGAAGPLPAALPARRPPRTIRIAGQASAAPAGPTEGEIRHDRLPARRPDLLFLPAG